MTSDRLDLISRPNLGRVGRQWDAVVPNDFPPTIGGVPGNTGGGCQGLFVSRAGYVRFIDRGHLLSMVTGSHHAVDWMDQTMLVEIELNGLPHPVQWLPAVPESIRVYAQDGQYLWAEVIHVLAHDTSATEIFSIRV